MPEKSRPLFSDDFLDELANEINALNGVPLEIGSLELDAKPEQEEGSSS